MMSLIVMSSLALAYRSRPHRLPSERRPGSVQTLSVCRRPASTLNTRYRSLSVAGEGCPKPRRHVLQFARRAAEDVLMENRQIRMSLVSFAGFVAALSRPGRAMPEMVDVARCSAPWDPGNGDTAWR
ncbi:MAG: DUF1778 domain-containing protein [Microvirga sp.]